MLCREEGSKDAANAYEAFLHAASIDGPAQAPAFAYLGHHFRGQGEELKARKCYRRSLEIDATQASAGLALCELLHDSNSEDIVKGICEVRSRLWLAERWKGSCGLLTGLPRKQSER